MSCPTLKHRYHPYNQRAYVFSVFIFDECGISHPTVKALADAGYVQTTVVQEAALPICLEGILYLFTFFRHFLLEKRNQMKNSNICVRHIVAVGLSPLSGYE